MANAHEGARPGAGDAEDFGGQLDGADGRAVGDDVEGDQGGIATGDARVVLGDGLALSPLVADGGTQGGLVEVEVEATHRLGPNTEGRQLRQHIGTPDYRIALLDLVDPVFVLVLFGEIGHQATP